MKNLRRWYFALLAVASIACGGSPPAGPGAELGIEVLGVELMAGGDLAKLSYRVTDYETARKALGAPAMLYAGSDGPPLAVMSAGRLGPLRQRPSASGKQQYMLFTNNAKLLQRGGTAELRLGAIRVSGIPVS